MKNQSVAIFPGSFDPFHLGHLDVVERSSRLFDRLIVAVGVSGHKKGLFGVSQRVEQITSCLKSFSNVEVDQFDGLLVEYMKRHNISKVVRGLRSSFDFEYETRMAQTNKTLLIGVETIFLATQPSLSHISSSLVRQIISMGGDIADFVPPQTLMSLNLSK